jgi:putative (di)nucleoside polyphosphate hydrolase
MQEEQNKQTKRYRPNVAAVVLSESYPKDVRIFIGLRSDMDHVWQFPQGGIDSGETAKEALLRELDEEIGTKNLEIVSEYPEWEHYDFPENAPRTNKFYHYDGQMQKYFLVRLKDNANLNINTKHPEFKEYQFVATDAIFDFISHFKKPIYKKVLNYFRKEGYL